MLKDFSPRAEKLLTLKPEGFEVNTRAAKVSLDSSCERVRRK